MVVPRRRLEIKLPDSLLEARKGHFLDTDDVFEVLPRAPIDLDTPDGDLLLKFRPDAYPLSVAADALRGLQQVRAVPNDHRFINWLATETIGYHADGKGCRQTEFTANNLSGWARLQPFFWCLDEVFSTEVPDRYENQRLKVMATAPEWVIPHTLWTSVAVNKWVADGTRDGQTPIHKDKGDLKEGFGVISVFRTGNYTGGYLVFPQYQVAVDLHTTDVLLCDVHQWHANAPIATGNTGWQRIATVLYYRTQLLGCPATQP